MKTLKILIRIDAYILALFGILRAFAPSGVPGDLEAMDRYSSPRYNLPFTFLGVSLVILAATLVLANDYLLIGNRRKLGRWLATGNFLLALTAFIHGSGQSVGDDILLLVPLVMALALGWASLRPLNSEEAAAELASLKVPDEIREALLRQVREAAAQEERNRLARDLHDSIKQQLFSINVGAATAQERWVRDPEGARAALQDVRRSVREAMVEMQAMLHQLRPKALGSSGLIEALREQCEALGYRTGAEVSLELGEMIPDSRMPPGGQETLFRMAQETLANIARHARARRVRIWLGLDGETASLRIEDDGQGFDPWEVKSGMGLRNLRERAASLRGSLEIDSAPGAGTRIGVRAPLLPPSARDRSPIEATLFERSRDLLLLALVAGLFGAVRLLLPGDLMMEVIRGAFFTVLLLAMALGLELRLQSAVRASPGAAPSDVARLRFLTYRSGLVFCFVATWWASWSLFALLCAGLTIVELIRLHRVSERRWPPFGGWAWPMEWSMSKRMAFFFVVLLSLSIPGFAPLGPWGMTESFLLGSGAVTLGYVLTRQPREEGA